MTSTVMMLLTLVRKELFGNVWKKVAWYIYLSSSETRSRCSRYSGQRWSEGRVALRSGRSVGSGKWPPILRCRILAWRLTNFQAELWFEYFVVSPGEIYFVVLDAGVSKLFLLSILIIRVEYGQRWFGLVIQESISHYIEGGCLVDDDPPKRVKRVPRHAWRRRFLAIPSEADL